MTRQHVQVSGSPQPSGSYSQATIANGLLYLSGIGPYDPVTRAIVGSTIEQQTAQVIKNIRVVLQAVGLGLGHVITATAYLADLERDWLGFDTTYGQFFTPPYPARTAVGSTLKHILVELAVVATMEDRDDI